jgi:trans-2,3-dihydro-3-hydroxyanthranilate isomerase
MQQIAAELGFSETVFIDASVGEVPLVRIFTPAMEMPFAGHPLVGAAWMMLQQESGVAQLRCGIGEVTIRSDGDVTWVDAPMIPGNAAPDDGLFARRVGLERPNSTWRVAMPLDYRMVELESAARVAVANPDTSAFEEAHGLTVYARSGNTVRMRFFIPEAGIDEDPATGSAAVALATMYAARGEPTGSLTIDQGEEIGHPSRINLRWSGAAASIGGTVVTDEVRELTL